MPMPVSVRAACCMVSQSDWLPMITPMSGFPAGEITSPTESMTEYYEPDVFFGRSWRALEGTVLSDF
jgi:hypothetical protein